MNGELWAQDAVDLARAIRLRKISSREAVQSSLARMRAVNPKLNAVVVDLGDEALQAADAADAAVKRGDALGPLHGVPVTIKENIDQTGQATVNGVSAYLNVIAKADSPPVAAWKAAGAVIVGRTNTPAFSTRWDTDNAPRGRTFNPWSKAHTPGGSSGGAGAALACGIGALAHGNDYGGSIRYPAYCCGVAGIRPTLGRVGAYNPSLAGERPPTGQLMSVQGPMARSVRDVRLGLQAMTARDPRDPWQVPAPLDMPAPARPIRVALCPDPSGQGVHPEVADAVRKAGAALADAGYAVEEVDPPETGRAAEVWAQLVNCDTRHMGWEAIRKDGDPDVVKAISLWFETIPDVTLPEYMKLVGERARLLRAWMLFFEKYPLVVGPVSTEPPFEIGFDVKDAAATRKLLAAQRLLVAVNMMGLPATAAPVGCAKNGVPLGVQVIGGRYQEMLTLDGAEAIEARCGLRTPIDPAW